MASKTNSSDQTFSSETTSDQTFTGPGPMTGGPSEPLFESFPEPQAWALGWDSAVLCPPPAPSPAALPPVNPAARGAARP